jgi:ABC-type multidrug transport system permease subunit
VPPAVVCVVSWLVPGAGHLLQGRTEKGAIFFVALTTMFAIGLMLNGRLAAFEFFDPLVGLAALANLGMGIPYFVARAMDLGHGIVTAASYEYGNTFLIVSGLLNMLVTIDAYDVRLGRK